MKKLVYDFINVFKETITLMDEHYSDTWLHSTAGEQCFESAIGQHLSAGYSQIQQENYRIWQFKFTFIFRTHGNILY